MRKRKKIRGKNEDQEDKITPLGIFIIIYVLIVLIMIVLFGTPVRDFYPGKPPWIE